jgi:ribosomal protein S18 acetylase RimI-like enzyme
MTDAATIVEADLADPHHAEALTALVDTYARDLMGGGRALDDHVLRSLVPALRRHPTTRALLAYEGDRPVGLAVCFVGFSTFSAKPILNVHDLAVLPGHRRQGIGRRLLEQAEALARDLGCVKLTLEVREDNEKAKRLYKSVGFGPGDLDADSVEKLFWTKHLG